MNRTVVKACSCKNTFMDARYGTNLRVMNYMGKGVSAKQAKKAEDEAKKSGEDTVKTSSNKFRCTCCSTTH